MQKQAAAIHPTAVVEPGAALGAGVEIGPFCLVGAEAKIGDGTRLLARATVLGDTTIGPRCVLHPGVVLGGDPQDIKHRGGPTRLEIGADCIFREGFTAHRGSDGSRGTTTIGSGCFFLAYSHVAHDCIIGDNVTFANQASIGGHCEIGDGVLLGAMTGVHQFVRIGHHAFITAMTGVGGDVIPYGLVEGRIGRLQGFNVIGMRRAGMGRAELAAMRNAYRIIFDPDSPMKDNLEKAAAQNEGYQSIADILAFLAERGHRNYCLPLKRRVVTDDDGA